MPVTLELLLSILVPLMVVLFGLVRLGWSVNSKRIAKLEERFEQKSDDIERNLRHRISDVNSSLVAAVSRMDHKRTDDLDRLFTTLEEVRQVTGPKSFKRRAGDEL